MIDWTIYLPFIGMIFLLAFCRENKNISRWVTFSVCLACLLITCLHICSAYTSDDTCRHVIRNFTCVSSLGIHFTLGIDGIRQIYLLLAGIISVAGVLISWEQNERPRNFDTFYLCLLGGIYGLLLSIDLFLFFVFLQIIFISQYVLIIQSGYYEKYLKFKLAATFLLASVVTAIVFLCTYIQAGKNTFDLYEIANAGLPKSFQNWAFPLSCLGFAILAGIWPFHSWLQAYLSSSKTGIYALITGINVKLGIFAIYQISIRLFPDGALGWKYPVVILAGTGVIFSGLVALSQKDLRKLITCASISQMGIIFIGMMTFSINGMKGSIFMAFSHGIIIALLYGIIESIHRRTGTYDIETLRYLNLYKTLPQGMFVFILGTAILVGMPLFSHSIGLLYILLGMWHSLPIMTIFFGIGLLITICYLLTTCDRVFCFENKTDISHYIIKRQLSIELDPITIVEKLSTYPLLILTFIIGIYPNILLNLISNCISTLESFPNIWN